MYCIVRFSGNCVKPSTSRFSCETVTLVDELNYERRVVVFYNTCGQLLNNIVWTNLLSKQRLEHIFNI